MDKIQLFKSKQIRSYWEESEELWYFSIVDIVTILTQSPSPRKYWNKLKQRLKEEGNETVTNCHQLKMKASDGKMRLTDVANTEQLLRLIQSIPSPQAEPFKMWLAKVGYERIEAIQWSGNTTKEYKKLKNLKKENLRDNMTNLELVLNMLAEATTTEISKEKKPDGLDESKKIAKEGGTIAGDTRKAIEEKTGKKVVTNQNAKDLLDNK